jgi:hypothetical protein
MSRLPEVRINAIPLTFASAPSEVMKEQVLVTCIATLLFGETRPTFVFSNPGISHLEHLKYETI